MRLYHFTDMANLKSEGTILRDGLLIPKQSEHEGVLYVAGIWLTANPNPVCWWQCGSFKHCCLITVEIRASHRDIWHGCKSQPLPPGDLKRD
jgi:hypothetical protein